MDYLDFLFYLNLTYFISLLYTRQWMHLRSMMRLVFLFISCLLLGCDNDPTNVEIIREESISGVLLGEFIARGVSEEDLRSAGIIGEATDVEGNTYSWVRIGSQIWMDENLRSTRYCDGSLIVESEVHDNDSLHVSFGKLYSISGAAATNLSSANPSRVPGACPCGWHLPSKAEFQEMINVINARSLPFQEILVSNRLRAVDRSNGGLWCDGKEEYSGNNFSGFSALPAGKGAKFGVSFSIINMFTNTFFWTSEPSYYSEIKKNDVYTVFAVGKGVNYSSPLMDFLPFTAHFRVSVRCVKNQ